MTDTSTETSNVAILHKPKIETYLDIETDGTTAGCNVWEIGAVIVIDGRKIGEFSDFILPQGGKSDPETIQWLKDKELYSRYLHSFEHGVHLSEALEELAESIINCIEFCNYSMFTMVASDYNPLMSRENHTVFTWGNFDIGILERSCKLPFAKPQDRKAPRLPWHYGSGCSLRDVHRYHGLAADFRPDTSKHEALADAKALYDFDMALYDTITDNMLDN